MKIAIMRSGNIGSLLSALLPDEGDDVTLVDLHNDLIDAIKKDGITIDASSGKSGHLSVKITNDVPSTSNYSHEFFNYNAGKQPGARTIRTGTQTERRILSAMLPHIQRLTPERP